MEISSSKNWVQLKRHGAGDIFIKLDHIVHIKPRAAFEKESIITLVTNEEVTVLVSFDKLTEKLWVR